ncbi:ribonuclease J [Alterisphingorhabdus coralli]|uniref:Ribonuclease J n=1 Tax=Alterisphingorhabdus coralli TaxID=3071408 RepID=A0AA97F423_9SPHN|nr:ribonuclease J [Parasphingorhabdus sp. SCSIO 66989]WOE73934.1 ribonuclease J [Parasphingorhabdus sp. SCSIO 66989]
MKPKDELLFLALGGSGEIGMNANLYGCQGKWVMADLGMTFSGGDYPGVDLVFPDLEFIEEREEDLLAIVLTHGHEDHIGALPYLAGDLGVPLYATAFTAGLIARKLEEAGLKDELDLHIIEENTDFAIGPFSFRYVPLAHSIAEGNALLIDTPHGKIFHTGDWKLDDEPLIGTPSTEAELRAIGDAGVLAMVCDSTNVFNPNASGSEGDVRRELSDLIAGIKGRVVVTTFASNVARMDTLGQIAKETKRTVSLAGRSLHRILENAQANGYLMDFPETIDFRDVDSLDRSQTMVIATGGQGETNAALARMASDSHPIKLSAGDTVIFSTKEIPGNEKSIGYLINNLVAKGVNIITEKQFHIHVSGHPGKPELAAMYDWIQPEILVPVHGELRHMTEQARFGEECGIAKTVVQTNGDMIRLAPGDPERVDQVRSGRLILDGDVILPADGQTMNQRRKIAYNGTISVAIALDEQNRRVGNVEIMPFGVPLDEDEDLFLEEADEAVQKLFSRKGVAKTGDINILREDIRLAVRRVATRWTGKKPVVKVLIVEQG